MTGANVNVDGGSSFLLEPLSRSPAEGAARTGDEEQSCRDQARLLLGGRLPRQLAGGTVAVGLDQQARPVEDAPQAVVASCSSGAPDRSPPAAASASSGVRCGSIGILS